MKIGMTMYFSEIMRFVFLKKWTHFLLKPRDESSFHNFYRHKRFLAEKTTGTSKIFQTNSKLKMDGTIHLIPKWPPF